MAATKRIIASTFDGQGSSKGKRKGKKSLHHRDIKQERSNGISIHTLGPEFGLQHRASKIDDLICMSTSNHLIDFKFRVALLASR